MHASLLLALLPAFALAAPAPIITPRDAKVIPGKFIVKLKESASKAKLDEAISLLASKPEFKYGFGSFNGFAGKISDATVKKLQDMDAVEYIQKDAEVHTMDWLSEGNSPWGLGRISHTDPGNTTYIYDSSAGEGTCVYILDTGILTTHPEFEGRAEHLANFAGDGTTADGNGHGTHCAGTVGSKSYGVAKKTKLYAVKVLNAGGSGTFSGVIAGINFAANDWPTRGCPNGAVGSMSLGGGKTATVNQAVANAVSAGLFMAVAAGNSNDDAQFYSPASEPTACTVGATDENDARASFSNYGSLVDIFAPGVRVLSTWNNNGTNSISGTSMATPHVAGLAAYLLTFENIPTDALCERIAELSLKDKITGLPSGTVNALAFNGAPSEL